MGEWQALLINGYNPLNYKEYKQIDDSGDLIIRAQCFDDDFNYIIARKKIILDGIFHMMELNLQ